MKAMDPNWGTFYGYPLSILYEAYGFAFVEYGPDDSPSPAGYAVVKIEGMQITYAGTSFVEAQEAWKQAMLSPTKSGHPNPSPATVRPSGGKVNNRTLVSRLGEHIPDFYERATCPDKECGFEHTLYNLVQHVNDSHRWPREAIADWLETLDLDLTVHQDPVKRKQKTPVKFESAGYVDGLSVPHLWFDEVAENKVLDELLADVPEDLMKFPQAPAVMEIDPEVIDKALTAMMTTLQPAIDAMSLAMKAIESTANGPEFQAFVKKMKADIEKKEQS